MDHFDCMYCKAVRRIAFWGPREQATWKRPMLFVCGLALSGGFGAVTWLTFGEPKYFGFALLAAPLILLGILGVMVSINGCGACVARLFGEA